jgi:hypothetical protein
MRQNPAVGKEPSMAKMSRDKGQRIERELAHLHVDAGIPATRVPLSGAAGGAFSGDLHILDFTAEVKAPKDGRGFRQLEAWLGDHVRPNRESVYSRTHNQVPRRREYSASRW